jgi:hypothetical protein
MTMNVFLNVTAYVYVFRVFLVLLERELLRELERELERDLGLLGL